ncbi:MAG: agmatine deiminase family protein [Bacteroidetes bacterium]|nr:agmatine deiminase family protein [Bacteroidota bacterium]
MNTQTDYSKVDSILIAYPLGYKNEYNELTTFYDKLITKIPFDITITAIVNNNGAKERLKLKFKNRTINVVVFEEWCDIWVRDIIGIGVNNSVVKPIYAPGYCNYLTSTCDVNKIDNYAKLLIKENFGKQLKNLPLKIDGGNIVINRTYAFITRRIFDDNPNFKEEEILKILSENLGITPIIVPVNIGDTVAHIDGYLAFMDDNTVAIVEYPKMDLFKHDNAYSDKLVRYCSDINLRIVMIKDRPVNQTVPCQCNLKSKKKYCCYSAVGNYINYIRLNNTIILPEYTLPTLKETMYYNNVNEETLSNMGFQVIKINCDAVAQFGGSLRCLSYTWKS